MLAFSIYNFTITKPTTTLTASRKTSTLTSVKTTKISTATSPAKPYTLVGSWIYTGCVSGISYGYYNAPLLKQRTKVYLVETCASIASKLGYKLIAMRGSDCYAGPSLLNPPSKNAVPFTNRRVCSDACVGNRNQFCGSNSSVAYSIYNYTLSFV